MSKDAKAQAVTITLIVGALVVIVWNQGGFDALGGDSNSDRGFLGIGSSRDFEPRDVIYSMLDAARDGNVDEYLECPDAYTIVEWPERIETLLPPDTIHININHEGEEERTLAVDEEGQA